MERPKIRAAKFADLPRLYGLICEGHARTPYARLCGVHEKICKQTLMGLVQRHNGGQKGAGGGFVAVAALEDGQLEGVIVGLLQPFYLVCDRLEATDLFWYARPGAHALTGARLLRAWLKWVPVGAIIRQGNTDATGSAEVSGRILERAGFRQVGKIYERMPE